jgi:hypothetical protein
MMASRSKHPETWLDLEHAATVEITSEGPHFPAKSVFQQGHGSGWRAGQAGEQRITVIFDQPVPVTSVITSKPAISYHFKTGQRNHAQD